MTDLVYCLLLPAFALVPMGNPRCTKRQFKSPNSYSMVLKDEHRSASPTKNSRHAHSILSMLNTLLPLDAPKLCRDAQRGAGLRDFGSPRLEPALSTLVQSLDREADCIRWAGF